MRKREAQLSGKDMRFYKEEAVVGAACVGLPPCNMFGEVRGFISISAAAPHHG